MTEIREIQLQISFELVMERLVCEKEISILDSSLVNDLGRYTIIGIHPYLTLIQGEEFTVNGVRTKGTIEEFLRVYLREKRENTSLNLPFLSGAIGYLSYDHGRKKEGIISRNKDVVKIPDSIFIFYDNYLILDQKEKKAYISACGELCKASESLDRLEEYLQQKEIVKEQKEEGKMKNLEGYKIPGYQNVTADFTKDDYKKAVQNMIHYIIEGDVYIINMTQQLQIKSRLLPEELFLRMRRENPSPFGAFLNYGDFQIVCASPERFLYAKDRVVRTRPIKGTRKRGESEEEDGLLKKELADSKKDQSELLMIVDLERNDLNKVCIPGTVEVTELFKVETYATVFHLIADIQGELREDNDFVDLFEAAFPGGSITGAPKLRAVELIDEQEHSKRNLYTGSIGYLSFQGNCDFNIVIRTALYQEGIYHLGVGGGITCESDLEFEYEETLQKARAFLNILGEKESIENENSI